jgi:putative protease
MPYQFIGKVTHFFDRISVAVVRLEAELYLEDWILIEGNQTDLEQQVTSMQIEHQPIEKGWPGDEVAIRTNAPVRRGDEVFVILEGEEP